MAALGDSSGSVRGGAASALGKIGPAARKALPALERLANNRGHDFASSQTADAAQEAIEAIEAK
jgi:HEAT repeat protein